MNIKRFLSMLFLLCNCFFAEDYESAGGFYYAICIIIKLLNGLVILAITVGGVYISIKIIWPSGREGSSLSDYVPFIIVLLVLGALSSVLEIVIPSAKGFFDWCNAKGLNSLFSSINQ